MKHLLTLTTVLLLAACTIPTAPPTPAGAIQGKHCFVGQQGKDVTSVVLNIKGDKVTGTLDWVPYEKDGSRGTLKGTINNSGLVTALYDYIIEGSHQTEQKQFKLHKDTLFIGQGELLDPHNDGNLILKDPAKVTFTESLERAECKE